MDLTVPAGICGAAILRPVHVGAACHLQKSCIVSCAKPGILGTHWSDSQSTTESAVVPDDGQPFLFPFFLLVISVYLTHTYHVNRSPIYVDLKESATCPEKYKYYWQVSQPYGVR